MTEEFVIGSFMLSLALYALIPWQLDGKVGSCLLILTLWSLICFIREYMTNWKKSKK